MTDRAPFDAFIDSLRDRAPTLEATQMFGKPCARLAGGKPVISYFQDAMVFKLGAARVQDIMAGNEECVPFDPSGKGRPFKDWVQVPESAGLDWDALAFEALGL
ncbi:MAG: hypothetical protein AAF891_09595 [Pseudomonadota bacterium]